MATQLTADFNSYIKNVSATQAYLLTGTTPPFIGGLVQLDAAGTAVAASGASALQIVGRAAQLSPDGLSISCEEGDVFMNLDGSNPPVQATVGKKVYATSDHEVGIVAGTAAVAGILVALQDGGALVRVSLTASR